MIRFLVFTIGVVLIGLALRLFGSYRDSKARVALNRRIGHQYTEADLRAIDLQRIRSIALSAAGIAMAVISIGWNHIFPPSPTDRTSLATKDQSSQSLYVPSDPTGTYTVIAKNKERGLNVVITKRSGSSGTTWSQRAYDCASGTVMYLGTGDSYAEMKASKPDPAMARVVSGSIADYVGREACR